MADSLSSKGNDSAFYYYNRVADNSTDRLEKVRAYNRMAAIQFNSGDHFGSQENVTESQKLLDEKISGDRPYLLSNYNLLGRSNLEQKNYDAAITYFKKADELQEKGKLNSVLQNNFAVAYQKKKDYSNAKILLQFAIDSSKQDTLAYARALSNLARTKWLEDSSYHAAPEMLTALKLREIKTDRRGLNASYSHLADYYFNPRPDSALLYAIKMYEIAQKLNSPDDQLEALQKLIKLSPSRDLKNYFERYQQLNDSLQSARNAAKNQFALIRYDAEKNKADNLLLQQDISNKRIRIVNQRIILFSTIAAFVIIAIIGISWYKKRKRTIEWEHQNMIRENQLKTSKRIHDVVANGLYRIMTDLEHKDTIEREKLLADIETLYEQSRDISHEKPVAISENFSDVLHAMLTSFVTPTTKVAIVGNHEKLWANISPHIKNELEYVLQELMVNMAKHSLAQNVAVKFEQQNDQIIVRYKDDGIGMPANFKFGNGIRNTENRINSIGGKIIFDTNVAKGLEIKILLPIGKAI